MLAYKLLGTGNQIAVCQLEPGQTAYCDAGRFLWKTPNVSVSARRRPSFGAPGGSAVADLLSQALDVGARLLAGEARAAEYAADGGGSGLVAFGGSLPGEMRSWELDGTMAWYAERDALVAVEGSVELQGSHGTGPAGASFGRLTGAGTVLISGGGTLVELNPARYGGTLQCEPGCLVAFPESVGYRVERPDGPDSRATIFSGSGRDLATLEGDGTVILQSLSSDRLARLLRRNATGDTQRTRPPGGYLSGIDDSPA